MKVYEYLAQKAMTALSGNDYSEKACDDVEDFLKNHGPSGSGIDCGTKICWMKTDFTKKEKIVLIVDYHHMDEYGGYCGWTEHNVVITPTMIGSPFQVKITGKNKNQIKDYLADTFYHWLGQECDWQTGVVYYNIKEQTERNNPK